MPRWEAGGSFGSLPAIAVDQGVVATERVGLLEAAIILRGRADIFVAEKQPRRLIFAGVRLEEQERREMAVTVGVEIDSRLLPN
jgi:hypothetical protein